MALDGIDELLIGFLTRRKSRLRSDEPVTFGVRPNDVRRSWLVRVSTEPPVVERDVQNHADVVLEASAETLYLACGTAATRSRRTASTCGDAPPG